MVFIIPIKILKILLKYMERMVPDLTPIFDGIYGDINHQIQLIYYIIIVYIILMVYMVQ